MVFSQTDRETPCMQLGLYIPTVCRDEMIKGRQAVIAVATWNELTKGIISRLAFMLTMYFQSQPNEYHKFSIADVLATLLQPSLEHSTMDTFIPSPVLVMYALKKATAK